MYKAMNLLIYELLTHKIAIISFEIRSEELITKGLKSFVMF